MVLSVYEVKFLICLMGIYVFVDDEYIFDLIYMVWLVVFVKGDYIRCGYCFLKKKVFERINGVK